MKRSAAVVLVVCLFFVACSDANRASVAVMESAKYSMNAPAEMATVSRDAVAPHMQKRAASTTPTSVRGAASLIPANAAPRKVIYNGSLVIQVHELKPFRTAIEELIQNAGGYIHSSRIDEPAGDIQRGTYTLRLPSTQLRNFINEVRTLGMVRNENVSSDDITDQYFDLEARLTNARRLEGRIIDLLNRHTAGLSDMIEVEHELARVRESIETYEGRKRVWDSQVEMSTLTVAFSMEQKVIAKVEPTFTQKIKAGFQDSVDTEIAAVQALTIGFASFLPWLLPLGILALVGVAFLNQFRAIFARLYQTIRKQLSA